jgi:lipoprotein-anchoring transpeptidase ErfK/SrfK
MTSRPRTGIKWRWVAAIALVLGSMWIFVWSGDGGNNATSHPDSAQAALPTGQGSPANTDLRSTHTPTSTSELPPSKELGSNTSASPTAEPVVETIRFGDVKNSSPITREPTTSARAGSSSALDDRQKIPTGPTSADVGSQLSRGMNMIREGRLVQGRKELSQLLIDAETANLSPLDAQTIRDTLASVNKHLVFSDEIVPGDPIAESYLVQSGDYLSRIAPKYAIPYQFIERINRIKAERLQAGKSIKVIKGPFHARISKSNYRMDIFVNDPDGQPLYIRSFSVGLGKTDSTPNGAFIVTPNAKVKNPSWRNPRTGEFFAKDNPDIPIGEYWLALKGTDANTESATGYGIHGTNDPSSVGRQASMGCVRMRAKDIELIYDMLEGGQSTVQIDW